MCPVLPTAIYEDIANNASVAEPVRKAAADQLQQNLFLGPALSKIPSTLAKGTTGNTKFTCTIYSLEGKYFWDNWGDLDGGSIKRGSNVANPNAVIELPGKKVQDTTGFKFTAPNGEDPAQKMTYDGFKATYDFYKDVFGRNSLDNNGMEIIASIHLARGFDNAFWDGDKGQMIFGDGGRWDGRGWLSEDVDVSNDPSNETRLSNQRNIASLSNWLDNYDLDTIGHELTHGVVEHTAKLGNEQSKNLPADKAKYSEAGTLNEHIADCFGIMVRHYARKETVDKAGWHFSPGQFSRLCCKANGWTSDYCRTFTKPDDPSKTPDRGPKHWNNRRDFSDGSSSGRWGLDPHVNCGIASHAFYLAAMDIGGNSWKTVGKAWYAALTDPDFVKPENQTFKGWRDLTVKQAGLLLNDDAKAKLEKAWAAVGL